VTDYLVWNVTEKRLEFGSALFPSRVAAEFAIAKLARAEQSETVDRFQAVEVPL
jgi:hypothetical protein